jgi:hypothetical protein
VASRRKDRQGSAFTDLSNSSDNSEFNSRIGTYKSRPKFSQPKKKVLNEDFLGF